MKRLSMCVVLSRFWSIVVYYCGIDLQYCVVMMFAVLDAKAELEREMAADSTMPAVKHHESRECVGMFEYRKDEEQLLVDNLITGK